MHWITGCFDSPGQERFKEPYFYIHMVGMPFNLMIGIMTLIGGGIMERYPRIKFVFLEIGAAWLPYWMWRMDDHYSRSMHHPTGVPKKPSDYVRSDSCFVSCEPDEDGLAHTAEVIGTDRIVFASDYPHGDCDFPHSVAKFRKRSDISDRNQGKDSVGQRCQALWNFIGTTKQLRSVRQIVPISFYFKSAQEYLHAALWVPKVSRGEGLIFCHGWGGGSQYDDLLEALADNGYFALRFHQRGYGESSGRSDLSLWTADMAAAAGVLAPITKKIWAAGQSTGGTMALVAAATQECFAGAVSLAPFCTLQQILLDNSEARSILEARFGPLQEKDYRAADALALTKGLTKPVLLIHGTKDETVPIAHGRQLARECWRRRPLCCRRRWQSSSAQRGSRRGHQGNHQVG